MANNNTQREIRVLSTDVLSDKQTDIKLEVICFLHAMFRMQDK